MSDHTLVEDAIRDAHLPALMTALVHLTGNADHLKPEWRPNYPAVGDRSDARIPPAEQAKMRAFATKVVNEYLAGEREVVTRLDAPTALAMMDYVAGVDIPPGYADYLADELALSGTSTKEVGPEWAGLTAGAQALHVVVIGAGMSGILAGIRLRQAGIPFTILEKNPDVGGTWFENRYPGCRVDSSNHMYSYSFEPNHDWPLHFSTQPVLLEYFRSVAKKYDLYPSIRFGCEVSRLVWVDEEGRWAVHTRDGEGREAEIQATAVITAVGQLNRPQLPEIDGRDSFAGRAFHSAKWPDDVDLRGKRVAVIGTGASAFQIIPEIAGQVESLTVFQRSPPWVFPTPHYHDRVPEGKKWSLNNIPYYDKWYRFWLFWMATDGLLPAVRVDPDYDGPPVAVSQANLQLRELILDAMRQAAPELADAVTPDYPIGSKRALLDNGSYFRALSRPNVSLVTDPIRRITPQGVDTHDGTSRAFDVIIYGTGFTASRFLEPMEVVGRTGQSLRDFWNGDPRAHLGITVPGYPNLFMLYGPNTNIVVNGSIIFFSECAVRYALGCLKMLARGAKRVEVKPQVYEDYNARVDAANAQMAWGRPGVSSWYKNDAGRVTQNWPFTLIEYWEATLAPRAEDFVIERSASLAVEA